MVRRTSDERGKAFLGTGDPDFITLKQAKEVSQEQWKETTVREVMMPIREEMMLDPDGEAVDALQKMIRSGEGRLPVVKDGKAVGIITRRDILNLLEIKTDLGE